MNKQGRSSKFSLLPLQVRYRAYNLLMDGATCKTVAEDPMIRTATEKAGVTLSPKNIAMVRKRQEFADFAAMRRKHLEAKRKDLMLAAISQGTGTLESMTEQARCRLMEALSGMSDLLATAKQGEDGSDEDRIKALRSLAQSMAAISNPAKDSRIADLQRKLRAKEAQLEAAEAEWKAREAELLAKLAEARKNTPAGMSRETLEEVEDKIKLL